MQLLRRSVTDSIRHRRLVGASPHHAETCAVGGASVLASLSSLGLALIFLSAPFTSAAQTSEVRALWVDAWSGDFATAAKCTQLVNDARTGNFNTLIVQVRRRGDAFYHSLYEPKNSSINSAFDPLQDLITKAHDTTGGKQRIEIHAWIVTFNIWNNETTVPAASTPPHPYNAHRDWLTRDVNGATWDGFNYAFDPAHPEVQRHTYNVAMDLVSHYAIDGLNWDYIRYAGPTWGYHDVAVARFNARTGRTGVPSSGDEAWKQFRRDEVTALVRKVYLNAIALKPAIKLSADTITWAPGPTSDAAWYASSAAWNSVLQDWRGWMEEGILDLNIPMTYFDHTTRATDFLNWSAFAKNRRFNRQVVIGPGLYLNSASNAIVQLRAFRQATPAGHRADGVCGYVYKQLNANNAVPRAEFLAALTQPSAHDPLAPAVFAQQATPPVMPWKSTPTKGHLKGTIAHELTGAELDGATVQVSGPENRTLRADGTGFFGAVDLAPGSYTLSGSFPGLEARTTNLVVQAGLVTTRNLLLKPSLADLFITNIQAHPGRSDAIVAWRLAEPVPSFVEYGTTPNLGSATPVSGLDGIDQHVLLTALPPGGEVFYRVVARAPAGDLRSPIASFPLAGEWVVDNPSAAFAGSWTLASSATDKYQSNYHFAGTAGATATATATFRPHLETPGRYDVYVWAPGGSNRSTNASFEIVYDGGQQTVRLNQTPQNAGWRLLTAGRPFLRGTNGYVRLANNTGESSKVVIADAVRWVYAAGQEPPAPGLVPEWWARFYFGGQVPGGMDHDADGATTYAEYVAGTAPNDAGSRLALSVELASASQFRVRFQPALGNRSYRLQTRSDFGTGTWLTQDALLPVMNPDGTGFFTLDSTAHPTSFHRLQVELSP